VKLYMWYYNRRIGRQMQVPALRATATDSLCDCVATTVVLLATLASRIWGVTLDGWAGFLVAIFVLWSGIRAVRETLDPLLGAPPSQELVDRIQELVLEHEVVQGTHDLVVHDYGPGRKMISLHAEVSAKGDLVELHDEIDRIERELCECLGCIAVIHMDPVVDDDGITAHMRQRVEVLVRCLDESATIHDFRIVAGPTHTNLIFDVVVPFQFRLTDAEVRGRMEEAVHAMDETYFAVVQVDHAYTRNQSKEKG